MKHCTARHKLDSTRTHIPRFYPPLLLFGHSCEDAESLRCLAARTRLSGCGEPHKRAETHPEWPCVRAVRRFVGRPRGLAAADPSSHHLGIRHSHTTNSNCTRLSGFAANPWTRSTSERASERRDSARLSFVFAPHASTTPGVCHGSRLLSGLSTTRPTRTPTCTHTHTHTRRRTSRQWVQPPQRARVTNTHELARRSALCRCNVRNETQHP